VCDTQRAHRAQSASISQQLADCVTSFSHFEMSPAANIFARSSRYPFSKAFCFSGFNLLAYSPMGMTVSSIVEGLRVKGGEFVVHIISSVCANMTELPE
jgi:hypothetical protein